jgi:circadian clock protein KaiC
MLSAAEPTPPTRPSRLATGVPGLDLILRGGLPRGGAYLLAGHPGTGKTTLAGQLCFHHIARGGRAVYLSLLAESNTRLLAHLGAFAFHDPTVVGDGLYLLSGFGALEEGGLRGLLDLLRGTLRERGATLLVIDGLTVAGAVAGNPLDLKRFLQELQAYLEAADATALLLTPVGVGDIDVPAQTLVDGILALHDRQLGAYAERQLEVVKCRGTGYLRGRHSFDIGDAGLVVHPRTEERYAAPSPADAGEGPPLPSGIPGLDPLLGGGVPARTTTLVLGPPGAGKTLLGQHFLAAGLRAGEPGLHFGFYEPPPRTTAKADRLGLGFAAAAAGGLLELLWQPPTRTGLDALAERLLDAVARQGTRRLVIDGFDGFDHAALEPERLPRVFAALVHELRTRGVTTLVIHELPEFFGPSAPVPENGSAELADNILFLRGIELRGQLRRALSVLKLAEGGFAPHLRELRLTPRGLEVAGGFGDAEAVQTGQAHPHGNGAETDDAATISTEAGGE